VFGTPEQRGDHPGRAEAGLPVIAPYTGALSVRGRELQGVFNIRASYAERKPKSWWNTWRR
jgi:hypothetical protein